MPRSRELVGPPIRPRYTARLLSAQVRLLHRPRMTRTRHGLSALLGHRYAGSRTNEEHVGPLCSVVPVGAADISIAPSRTRCGGAPSSTSNGCADCHLSGGIISI